MSGFHPPPTDKIFMKRLSITQRNCKWILIPPRQRLRKLGTSPCPEVLIVTLKKWEEQTQKMPAYSWSLQYPACSCFTRIVCSSLPFCCVGHNFPSSAKMKAFLCTHGAGMLQTRIFILFSKVCVLLPLLQQLSSYATPPMSLPSSR